MVSPASDVTHNNESNFPFTDAQYQQLTQMIQTSLKSLTPWNNHNSTAANVSSNLPGTNAFT